MQRRCFAAIMDEKGLIAMTCPKCGSAELEIQRDDDYNSYIVIRNGYGLGLLLAYFLKKLCRKHYGDTYVCGNCGSKWRIK